MGRAQDHPEYRGHKPRGEILAPGGWGSLPTTQRVSMDSLTFTYWK